MKFDSALQIPAGTTIAITNTGGAVNWDSIPPLKTTLVYSAATVDVVAATNTYHRNVGNWSGFQAGDLVEVAGFVNGGNNFRKRVVSVTGPNMVVATVDPMILEAAGAAVTFTRIDEMPKAVRVFGNTATSGKMSLGIVGDATPASDAAFFAIGAVPQLVEVLGYEIFWFTYTGAATQATISPVANY